MMKRSAVLVFILAFAAAAFAQAPSQNFDLSNYGVRIEPDRRVLLVLATLDAARVGGPGSAPVLDLPLSAEGLRFRETLRSDSAAMPADLREKITNFVVLHKRRNAGKTDSEIAASFISMAYALTPAPEFADPVVTGDLPGHLLDVLDFAPLAREFYRRTNISANINEYIKTYQRSADGKLRNSAREMVNEILLYLHTRPELHIADTTIVESSRSKKGSIKAIEKDFRERRFFIVPEMLAPKGTVNFVNVRDDYFVVVPPDIDLTFSEVRRAFLRFVVDPLVIKHAKDVAAITDDVKKVMDARRAVDSSQSPDVFLTISRSLVAAIDAKQNEAARVRITTAQARERIDSLKTDAEKRTIADELRRLAAEFKDEAILQMYEDYEKGSLLVFYFAEHLDGMEDSGFDIAASMREMLLSFDATKETGRPEQFAAERKRALAAREAKKNAPATSVITSNPVTDKLIEIQANIAERKFDAAEKALKELLENHPDEPRIYYNVGRLASLRAESLADPAEQRAKLLEAKVGYENVIRIASKKATDAALVSLSYAALAKIYEFYGEPAYAIGLYDRVIAVGPITGGAYDEALAAKARLIKEQ